MEFSGSHRIEAPRNVVWRALNDPGVLQRCIGGCQEMVALSPTEFAAKVRAKVGPMKTTFTIAIRLSDLVPLQSYTIHGEGQGGIAGFAKGAADVVLEKDGDATVLSYVTRVDIGGGLARLGGRLIESNARQVSDEFFEAFRDIVDRRMARKAASAAGG